MQGGYLQDQYQEVGVGAGGGAAAGRPWAAAAGTTLRTRRHAGLLGQGNMEGDYAGHRAPPRRTTPSPDQHRVEPGRRPGLERRRGGHQERPARRSPRWLAVPGRQGHHAPEPGRCRRQTRAPAATARRRQLPGRHRPRHRVAGPCARTGPHPGGTGSGQPNQQWGGTLPEGTETPLGADHRRAAGGLRGGVAEAPAATPEAEERPRPSRRPS